VRRWTAVAAVLAVTAAWVLRDSSPVGHWRSEAARLAYVASYRRAMALLPPARRTLDVPTSYGRVRVYAFGRPEGSAGIPLVLLPGRASGVPMWSANLAGLAEERTVYALDALGDAGLGEQTRAITSDDDQAAWLDEVLTRLDAPRAHLVGHSFGGALATGYALRHPDRAATLTLLEPILVLQGLRWQVYLRAMIASLPFLPQRWRTSALAGLGGADEVDLDDPVAQMIADAAAGYASALPVPNRPSTDELRTLTMPVLALLAEDSPMHDGAAAVDVARASLPDVTAELWRGTSHSLPMERPGEVDAAILAFTAVH
jgi:pimeloyl-ACP methyl ester carboxylesterase